MNNAKRIGIIGGGFAGLTAGYRLADAGYDVSIYEAQPQLGGQAATFPVEGNRLEIFYHHIFTSDQHIVALMRELGIADELQWIASKMGYFHGGEIYDFVTPLDLLRFKPLSLVDRLRCGLLTLYLQRTADGERFRQVTATEWLRRMAGDRAYRVLFESPLRGKFGDQKDEVSMMWFWGKVRLRAGSRQAGMTKEVLGYPRGSFQIVIDALAAAIRARGGRVQTGAPVERIVTEDGRAVGVQVAGQPDMARFDKIIATVPSPVFLQIAPELPEAYAARLRWVRYQTALCLVLKMTRSLSRIYWLNISDPEVPFVAAIEHTNYIPPENYGGYRLLYLSNYLTRTHRFCAMSKEELLAEYTPALRRINPEFDPSWVVESWLFRDDAGQPIVTCDYAEHIPDHRTPVPDLYLANTTQIYPEDRGTNYSVRLGNQIAALVREDIARESAA